MSDAQEKALEKLEHCWRWGKEDEPKEEWCILPADHIGPCVTVHGPTLPKYV